MFEWHLLLTNLDEIHGMLSEAWILWYVLYQHLWIVHSAFSLPNNWMVLSSVVFDDKVLYWQCQKTKKKLEWWLCRWIFYSSLINNIHARLGISILNIRRLWSGAWTVDASACFFFLFDVLCSYFLWYHYNNRSISFHS